MTRPMYYAVIAINAYGALFDDRLWQRGLCVLFLTCGTALWCARSPAFK